MFWQNNLTVETASRILVNHGLSPIPANACDPTNTGIVMTDNGLDGLICFLPNGKYSAGKYRINDLHQLVSIGAKNNTSNASNNNPAGNNSNGSSSGTDMTGSLIRAC